LVGLRRTLLWRAAPDYTGLAEVQFFPAAAAAVKYESPAPAPGGCPLVGDWWGESFLNRILTQFRSPKLFLQNL